MANWKVAKEIVEIFPHTNADSLEIVRAGEFQLVSGKGNYKTGDVVIVIPDKSILSNGAMILEYEKYLSGPKKNKVKQAQLRGEVSQGITWPTDHKLLEATFDGRTADLILAAPLGEDISELLGITKYEPPIPANMAGEVAAIPDGVVINKHDVLQFGAYYTEFLPDERVIVTEKLHGTQISYTLDRKAGQYEIDYVENDGVVIYKWDKPIVEPVYTEIVTSKGNLGRDLHIKESERNLYWQAVRNSGLLELAKEISLFFALNDEDAIITLHGEVVPAQPGYNYGQTKPVVKVFGISCETWRFDYALVLSLQKYLKDVIGRNLDWVPVLYDGPFKDADLYTLAKGKEQVSGKELHIREGVVVQPFKPRKTTTGGYNLLLKVINPAYARKETGEELS